MTRSLRVGRPRLRRPLWMTLTEKRNLAMFRTRNSSTLRNSRARKRAWQTAQQKTTFERMKELVAWRESGLVDEEEFKALKKKMLAE
jgi:hypothetical protein